MIVTHSLLFEVSATVGPHLDLDVLRHHAAVGFLFVIPWCGGGVPAQGG